MNTPATSERVAIAIDIDSPFQRVLAAWLAARSYRVTFLTLAGAFSAAGRADLVLCELAEPKGDGAQALRRLAHTYPGAPLIAISPRFVGDARRGALAHQLGVQAALAKPCLRYDFDAALDAALAMPTTTPPTHDHRAAHRPRHGR
jgi:CheY-like chemotaxis protein